MKAYIQVVGQSSPEGPPSIIVHYDSQRYMFNCREGTQRLSLETNELNDSTTVENKGPLKVTPVNILPDQYSPSGTKRRWDDKNAEKDMDYRKSVLRHMFPVGKSNPPAHTIEAPCTPPDVKQSNGDNKQQQKQRSMEYLRNPLPRTRPYPVAISYICRGPVLPGKFNPKAAKDLDIPAGPIYGRLQRGETVTLEDGRKIEPNQVVGPASPGHLFMIIDCPNQTYLNNLIHSDAFKRYQQTKEKGDQPCTIIHLIGQDVLDDKRYRDWMNLFSPTTEHIISTQEICAQTILYKSHAHGQVKLSKLDDQIFPVPHYSNTATRTLKDYTDLPKKCIPLSNMLQYNLEPKPGVAPTEQGRYEFDHKRTSKKIQQNQEYMEAVEKAKKNASTVDTSQVFPGDNVEVITLGTGSSIPSKYRNVSATLVKTPDNGSIMLDAGEGTLGQMMRRFGPRLKDELQQLKCIFVSHLHADHHLGVIQLLTKWAELNQNENKKLYVVAPFIFNTWLHEYSGVESFGFGDKVVMVRNESILTNRYPTNTELEHKMNAVNVIHCRYAYGLTIDHQTGWKLVYSGDTRPCDNLVEAGQNATLLIHEATLEDGMKAEAIAKRHSTTEEAVEVGQNQRYPKVPSLSSEQSNVCFSFDLMTIPIKRIPVLPKYTEAISLLFKEEEEQEQEVEDGKKNVILR
ncbi:beta-lactamase-like protein [Phascolomyces articulosus]|uniref:ribonuclease Z n=1 Tax=Phascolomyces articulosus TaxID=60185 RepID=A0AAD5K1I5_9FUNG|nr:beta-lactamase-like protein [Phascolomyces articulosus]